MGHDATKILMGTTKSSFRIVENHKGSIDAGKIVRLKANDTITTEAADGAALGISLGKSQSDIGYTPIVKKGTGVPVLLTAEFTPTIGDQVAIHDTTGLAATKDGSSTYVNAYYETAVLVGVAEDGTEVDAALISFPGGL